MIEQNKEERTDLIEFIRAFDADKVAADKRKIERLKELEMTHFDDVPHGGFEAAFKPK